MVLTDAMTTEVLRDPALFFSMADPWDELLGQSKAACAFLSHGWLAAWWRVYGGQGRELHVVTCRQGDRLVGVAPWYSEHVETAPGLDSRLLRFIGDREVSSDYLDIIAARGFEEPVLAAVQAHLEKRGRVNLLARAVLEDSLCLRLLRALEHSGRVSLHIQGRTPCPYIPLPETEDAFMDQPDTLFKSIVKRETKRLLNKHDVQLVFAAEEDTIEEHLERLFVLNESRWRSAGESGAFTSERKRRFYHEVASALGAEGRLGLAGMRLDGELAAVQFGVVFGDTYYASQMGRDPKLWKLKAGNVLQMLLLRELLGKYTEFNALRGGQRYKYQWGGRNRYTVDVHAWSGLAGATAARWWGAVSAAKRVARFFLRQSGAQKMARRLARWASWTETRCVALGPAEGAALDEKAKSKNRHVRCRQCSPSVVEMAAPYLSPESTAALTGGLERSRGVLLTVGGLPAGWALFGEHSADLPAVRETVRPAPGYAVLEEATLLPGYDREEYARLLLANAALYALERGCKLVCLTDPGMEDVVADELGFAVIGTVVFRRVLGRAGHDLKRLKPFLVQTVGQR